MLCYAMQFYDMASCRRTYNYVYIYIYTSTLRAFACSDGELREGTCNICWMTTYEYECATSNMYLYICTPYTFEHVRVRNMESIMYADHIMPFHIMLRSTQEDMYIYNICIHIYGTIYNYMYICLTIQIMCTYIYRSWNYLDQMLHTSASFPYQT